MNTYTCACCHWRAVITPNGVCWTCTQNAVDAIRMLAQLRPQRRYQPPATKEVSNTPIQLVF